MEGCGRCDADIINACSRCLQQQQCEGLSGHALLRHSHSLIDRRRPWSAESAAAGACARDAGGRWRRGSSSKRLPPAHRRPRPLPPLAHLHQHQPTQAASNRRLFWACARLTPQLSIRVTGFARAAIRVLSACPKVEQRPLATGAGVLLLCSGCWCGAAAGKGHTRDRPTTLPQHAPV